MTEHERGVDAAQREARLEHDLHRARQRSLHEVDGGHVRLDQENRMPAFWLELGIGFRLGD